MYRMILVAAAVLALTAFVVAWLAFDIARETKKTGQRGHRGARGIAGDDGARVVAFGSFPDGALEPLAAVPGMNYTYDQADGRAGDVVQFNFLLEVLEGVQFRFVMAQGANETVLRSFYPRVISHNADMHEIALRVVRTDDEAHPWVGHFAVHSTDGTRVFKLDAPDEVAPVTPISFFFAAGGDGHDGEAAVFAVNDFAVELLRGPPAVA